MVTNLENGHEGVWGADRYCLDDSTPPNAAVFAAVYKVDTVEDLSKRNQEASSQKP